MKEDDDGETAFILSKELTIQIVGDMNKESDMHILISGGSGFLGRAFSDEIMARYRERKKALQVTWLTRDSNQAHPDDVAMMTYDELTKTDKSFDVIINLAGAGIADSRWSDSRKEQLMASRIRPTEALLAFIYIW